MSVIIDGTNGITSPGGDSAVVDIATPKVKNAGTLKLEATGANQVVVATNGVNRIITDSSGRVTKPFQPAFQVVGAVSGSISAGSKIEFTDAAVANAVFNTGGHWSNANDRFTAPVAGKYLFYCAIYYQNASTTFGSIAPRINGSQITAGDTFLLFDGGTVNLGSTDNQAKGAFVFDLAANDYVELFVRTGATTLSVYSGHSFFGGYLLG